MANLNASHAVSLEKLLVSSLVQTEARVKLLIEEDLITQRELLAKIAEERAAYQRMLNPTRQ